MKEPSPNPNTLAPTGDLEIKDAKIIFDAVWQQLEAELGHEQLRFPKEIILLGGAPGAGKGTNTGFIMQARGFTCPPIVVSSLLASPEMRALIDQGRMVGDREVVGLVFREILKPDYRDGAILDGFPRTNVQVECLRLLVEKINELHREFNETDLAGFFRKPTIHAMVLFVEESTSIERQLKRGEIAIAHNEKVRQTGEGELMEMRKTDTEFDAAQKRYRTFKEQTWDALQSLRSEFFYHFINAQGSIKEVEQNIYDELQYQSSLELDSRTFDRLRSIPLASEIVVHARQELVKRLDDYELNHQEMFARIVELIKENFMPIVTRHAISGQSVVSSVDEVFHDPLALSMVIDIFSERGYRARVDKRLEQIPYRFDLQTGEINCKDQWVYRIQVFFEGSEIRR